MSRFGRVEMTNSSSAILWFGNHPVQFLRMVLKSKSRSEMILESWFTGLR